MVLCSTPPRRSRGGRRRRIGEDREDPVCFTATAQRRTGRWLSIFSETSPGQQAGCLANCVRKAQKKPVREKRSQAGFEFVASEEENLPNPLRKRETCALSQKPSEPDVAGCDGADSFKGAGGEVLRRAN